jgi:6-phosphogluconolactonase (cycloisomerase 2 family)
MFPSVWRDFAAMCLVSFVVILLTSCGGSSASSAPSGNSVSSGNYILQASTGPGIFIATENSNGSLGGAIDTGGPASNGFGYPSFSVAPSRQYLYALDTVSNWIRVYSIDGPGFTLRELSATPYTTTATPYSLAVNPAGSFLFTVGWPARIEEFSVNASTGVLKETASVTENADLRESVITPSGKFLFANDLTGGRIFGYAIGTNGSITTVPGSPFAVAVGGQPTRVIVDASGKYLYAPLYHGGIAAFAIDASTGALGSVPGSPFSTTHLPSGIIAASAGFLYVTNDNGFIDGFSIATTGALSPVPGSPFATAESSASPVVDASGQFLYIANYEYSTIYGFKVDTASGSLTAVVGSPFASMAQPQSLVPLTIP